MDAPTFILMKDGMQILFILVLFLFAFSLFAFNYHLKRFSVRPVRSLSFLFLYIVGAILLMSIMGISLAVL